MGDERVHPPSWRIHRAHPALGLEEAPLTRPSPRELGVAWLALDAAEQRRREADLEAALRTAGSNWTFELVEAGDVLGVGIETWKAPTLERELLDHVWEQARQRRDAVPERTAERRRHEVDRTVRAHVLVAWDGHAFKAFLAVMALAGLLGLQPWGDGSVGAVAVRIAIAVALLIALGGVVKRWYRRSDRPAA
ncbi:MAG TPA: hypothetical protein VF250_14765 [Conexibacter sp.]